MTGASRLRRMGIALAMAAGACSPTRGAEEAIAITGVTVIDGTGARARVGQTVVVRGSRIAQVGPAASVRVPPGARRLDGRGGWLIPGCGTCTSTLSATAFPTSRVRCCWPTG